MPQQPLTVLARTPFRGNPLFGQIAGFLGTIISCDSAIVGNSIALTVDGFSFTQFINKYYTQARFSFIADAAPTVDGLVASINALADLPVYVGSVQGAAATISEGDYCELVLDPTLDVAGAFRLLNWTAVYASIITPSTLIVTDNTPILVGAGVGTVIFDKAVPGASSVTLGPTSARGGLALGISDFSGNSGDITITPDASDTGGIMGHANWIIGSGNWNTFKPSPAILGWAVV